MKTLKAVQQHKRRHVLEVVLCGVITPANQRPGLAASCSMIAARVDAPNWINALLRVATIATMVSRSGALTCTLRRRAGGQHVAAGADRRDVEPLRSISL